MVAEVEAVVLTEVVVVGEVEVEVVSPAEEAEVVETYLRSPPTSLRSSTMSFEWPSLPSITGASVALLDFVVKD